MVWEGAMAAQREKRDRSDEDSNLEVNKRFSLSARMQQYRFTLLMADKV